MSFAGKAMFFTVGKSSIETYGESMRFCLYSVNLKSKLVSKSEVKNATIFFNGNSFPSYAFLAFFRHLQARKFLDENSSH